MAGKKTILDGIIFDSLFECDIYKLLKENNINIKSTHPEFLLFEDFTYMDIYNKEHKVRKMKYTGDFLIETQVLNKPLIVESKHGIITNDYLKRRKLFLMKYSGQYYFHQINSIKEAKELIEKLKENK